MKRYHTVMLLALIVGLCVSCGQQSPEPKHKPETAKVQWIDPSKIQPGPIRHESLPEDMVERIKAVQAVFAEVDPTPPAKWVEDFKRDMNPDRELAIWEAMAGAYTSYSKGRDLSLVEKKELFGILLTRSGSSTEDALAHLELKSFNKDQAREAMELLAQQWQKAKPPTTESTPTN